MRRFRSTEVGLDRASWLRRREALVGLAFVAPVISGFLVFNVGPILASLALSFTNYNILDKYPDWVGVSNLTKAFNEEVFWKSLGNTLYYTAFRIPLSIVSAFVLAVLVKQTSLVSTFYRTAIYVPSVVPTVGSIIVWLLIFNPQFGILNQALAVIGIQGPTWLLSPTWAKPALIIINLWQIGGTFVIFLAGLQGIPVEYYEAAIVDGAGIWHSFWKITVPLMTPTIMYNLVIEAIYAFQVFEVAFISTAGGPLQSTYFMSIYIYHNAFAYMKMGYASAVAWVLFVLIMTFTLVVLRSSKRWVFFLGGANV